MTTDRAATPLDPTAPCVGAGRAWHAFALALPLVAACASSGGVSQGPGGGGRVAFAAPGWFTAPPKHGASTLYFVGDASGAADNGAARDLAIQKAMAELTVYCGASVRSDARSTVSERNGTEAYEVSLSLDVAGDEITVREAVVTKTAVGAGSDGRFDGYVLLEWPRAQYEGVLAMQRQRAASALAKYLEAETAFERDGDTGAARTTLKEAKSILGPMKSAQPLDHAKHKNTGLLFDAVSALAARLDKADDDKRGVYAVAAECTRDGKSVACAGSRAGALRQALARAGKEVLADGVPPKVAAAILSSESPAVDRTLRRAGYVAAVRYAAELQGVDGPFTFVRTSARCVVFDTGSGRILRTEELQPEKHGHPTYEGAMEKGFGQAERRCATWLEAEAAKLK